MAVHLFGIRHHGPGCARSLRDALSALEPDLLLVEGPPDAEEVLSFAGHGKMKPPVALLVYPADAPHRAVYFPLAEFSPEWQALRYASEKGIPARFMDLPQAIQFGMEMRAEEQGGKDGRDTEVVPVQEGESEAVEAEPGPTDPEEAGRDEEDACREDPLGLLAEAAGYEDRELWWELQVEQRRDATGLFEGILAAMTELRKEAPPPRRREALREAFMRTRIRAAAKEGFQKVAVVCGAWHAPALTNLGPAKVDQALLKDLPKVKVQTTWIPWTHSRLSYRSGYGAGVSSPGWYQHLWASRDRAPIRWITQAARLMRGEDLDASAADLIEAVRLAESLAALRALPMPTLAELNEAVLTVLCHGEVAPMALIRSRLEIGDALGEVPEETPSVPLQKDLEAQQKKLRLKPTTEYKLLDLDLREENDRGRSRLLHRLALLGVHWGDPKEAAGKSGTFHEYWNIQWQPEFAVRIVEANVWGNTVEAAATAFARDAGDRSGDLPRLTELLDAVILAGLPEAADHLLRVLQDRAAVSSDVRHMMEALPALARVARYGDVRGTGSEAVLPVFAGLFERVLVGLPLACASLDDGAAAAMAESISRTQGALGILDIGPLKEEWAGLLRQLADRQGVHGLVRGLCCRLLLDQGALDQAQLVRRARLSLSTALPPREAAAWVEGLLRGSGFLLLHHDGLWAALDEWLVALHEDGFMELLPLLRRAFSGFQAPERRQMGEKVKRLGVHGAQGLGVGEESVGPMDDIDRDRAARVLPVLARILGVEK